jgi:hypothetical protein
MGNWHRQIPARACPPIPRRNELVLLRSKEEARPKRQRCSLLVATSIVSPGGACSFRQHPGLHRVHESRMLPAQHNSTEQRVPLAFHLGIAVVCLEMRTMSSTAASLYLARHVTPTGELASARCTSLLGLSHAVYHYMGIRRAAISFMPHMHEYCSHKHDFFGTHHFLIRK